MNIIANMDGIYIVQCGNGSVNKNYPNGIEQFFNVYDDLKSLPLKTHWAIGGAFAHMMELIR